MCSKHGEARRRQGATRTGKDELSTDVARAREGGRVACAGGGASYEGDALRAAKTIRNFVLESRHHVGRSESVQ